MSTTIRKPLQSTAIERKNYERILCEIEKTIKTLYDSCSYGDYNCSNCDPPDDGTGCLVRIRQKILSAIRKTRK